jgi:hypothetical protein
MSETDESGRPLRIDDEAESADPVLPAFLAKPAGAPVYHGFPILEDVNVDGFRLGMITDWEAETVERGDGFVVGPDGSRCGLDWEVSAERRFEQVLAPDVRPLGSLVCHVPGPDELAGERAAEPRTYPPGPPRTLGDVEGGARDLVASAARRSRN